MGNLQTTLKVDNLGYLTHLEAMREKNILDISAKGQSVMAFYNYNEISDYLYLSSYDSNMIKTTLSHNRCILEKNYGASNSKKWAGTGIVFDEVSANKKFKNGEKYTYYYKINKCEYTDADDFNGMCICSNGNLLQLDTSEGIHSVVFTYSNTSYVGMTPGMSQYVPGQKFPLLTMYNYYNCDKLYIDIEFLCIMYGDTTNITLNPYGDITVGYPTAFTITCQKKLPKLNEYTLSQDIATHLNYVQNKINNNYDVFDINWR